MAHEFDSGLFVNSSLTKEWHGLGRVVATAPRTTAEAMRLAGMDWQVNELPVISMGADDEPFLVDGWKTLQRSDNGKILHVCRDTWTPVQNSEAFSWFDPFIQDGDVEISAAVSLREGRRIAITAKIKGEIDEVVSGDPIEAFLLLFNAHDGSLSLGVKFTNIRVVCANTLAMNLYGEKKTIRDDMTWNGKTARVKHTTSIKANMEAVRDALDIQRRAFRYSIEQYRAMAQVQLTSTSFDSYLSKAMTPNDNRFPKSRSLIN
jgi:phage/plasmid-like protein (TIGR03299 family)